MLFWVINMIRVISPATSANLGPGFDVLAVALERPEDTMEFCEIDEGIEIEVKGYSVPASPEKNITGIVANRMLSDFKIDRGVRISLNKGIRPMSGLGSSAASSTGTVIGISELFDIPMNRNKLLEYSLIGEKATSGSFHADNISACLLGGLTIALSKPLKAFRFDVASSIGYVAVLPDIEVNTREARKTLPKNITLSEYSSNLARACLLVRALEEGDFKKLNIAYEDNLITPMRSKFVPFYHKLKKEALGTGAEAFFISGSGPATLSLFNREEVDARDLAEHLKSFYLNKGIDAEIYWGKIGEGARVT